VLLFSEIARHVTRGVAPPQVMKSMVKSDSIGRVLGKGRAANASSAARAPSAPRASSTADIAWN